MCTPSPACRVCLRQALCRPCPARRVCLRQASLLLLAAHDSPVLADTQRAMEEHDMPCQQLTAGQVRKRYPMLRYANEDVAAVVDESAGMLVPDQCIAVIQVVRALIAR